MGKSKKKKQTKTQPVSTEQKTISNEVLESLIESAKRDYSKYMQNKEFLENPSRVLKKTKEGSRLGLELFEEMRSDDQVSAELQIRNSKAAAAPFSIIVPGGDDSDLKQAVELEKQIDPIYRKIVEEIQDALMMGYAIIELNWEVIDNRVELPGVSGHKQKEFTFTKEKELIMTTEDGKQVPVQPDRVIVANFRERKGCPFGDSLCNELFFPWFFKKHDWIYWGNYLEKFGQPTAIGYYPPGTQKPKQQLLLEALQAIQNDMAVIMPADMKAEFLEAKRGGSADGYKDFYRTCNTQISKVINLSTLMANESEFGTRAQAQVHEDISDFAPEKDTLWIAEILTDTVVERLARWNYNFSVKPQLVINYEKEKTGKETAETDKIISDIVPITLEEMYERYKKRKPQDDDIVSFQGKLYVWKDLKAKIEKGEPQAADQPVPPSNFAEFSAGDIDDMDRVVMGDNDIIDGWGDLWGALLEDTIDLKELQKMLEKAGDYKKAIPALDKYKSKKSADLWQKCLTAAALLGESSVQKQIEAANESSEFAELDIDNKFHFGHPDEAIKYFKRKLPIPKAVWNSIDGEMKNYAFYVSQLEDTGLINFIKEKMIEALEKGKTFQMFAKELFEVSGTKQFFGYMKTSFNTNMFNALNYQNGVALLRNVKRFPYWRYSAVMDGKTRESHAAMHGYVARYDDSIWSSWYPPCGFNCRCRITIASQKQFKNIDDDFKKRAKAIHPDEGFETSPVENLKGNVIKLLKKKGAYSLNLNTEIRRAA